jgi:hypothetical protein
LLPGGEWAPPLEPPLDSSPKDSILIKTPPEGDVPYVVGKEV